MIFYMLQSKKFNFMFSLKEQDAPTEIPIVS